MMRLLLVLLLVFVPLSSRAQPAPGGPPAVGVVRAERQQITETDEFIGRIQSVGRVALVARVSAYLEKRLFVEGSEVKKGDLLYLLEQPPFQAQVDADKANVAQLEAQHTYAEQQLARSTYLMKTPAGQQQTVDQDLSNERSLAAQVASAKAQLEIAEINLGYTEIRAPIDGKISATDVTEGNVVSPTTGTLANLVSQDPMYVLYPVSVRAGLDLRNRYDAKGGFNAVVLKIRLPDGRIYGQNGKLDYVSPTVATNTDTITVRGRHPQPAVSGHAAGRAGSARAVRRRVRDGADRGRRADYRSRHPARRGAVGSARRLRLCRRCAEQGGATAHPARPVDAVNGRGEQWAQGRRTGHQRGAAAGSPRPDRVTQSGDPAAGDFPGG